MTNLVSFFMLLIFAAIPLHAQDQQVKEGMEAQETSDVTQEEINEISKAFGHFMGSNLNSPQLNLNIESVIQGIREGYDGKEPPMSQMEFQQKLMKFQEKMQNKISTQNLDEAESFLEKNKANQDINVLEEGKLQYQVLEEGSGPEVEEHARPVIEYSGKFLDGTEFGSTEQMGRPLTIPLDNTIAGFKKGLVGMREGEKRRLWIHPDLGYGTTGRLQPNALLVFDIKILEANSNEPEEEELDGEDDSDTPQIQ